MPPYEEGDSTTVAVYAGILLRAWRNTLAFAALGVLCSTIYLHLATPTYTASLTVVATEQQNQGSSSDLGQLASFVGLRSSSQTITPFEFYPEALTSRIVADDLAGERPDILRRMFAWDEKTQTWRRPGPFHVLTNLVKGLLGIPVVPWHPPSGAELRDAIQDSVSVTVDNRRPIITLSFDSADPNFAKNFLEAVNKATDDEIKKMTLDRSSKYAQYLESRLAIVQAAELRQVLIASYSQQATQMMLSGSGAPFAAQPLGGAVVSQRPTHPKALGVLLVGLICGVALGAMDTILRWGLMGSLLRLCYAGSVAIVRRPRHTRRRNDSSLA